MRQCEVARENCTECEVSWKSGDAGCVLEAQMAAAHFRVPSTAPPLSSHTADTAVWSLAGAIAYLLPDMSFAKHVAEGPYVAVVCSDPPHTYAYTWVPDGEPQQSRSARIPLTSMAR